MADELYGELKREVDMLGRALGDAIRRLSGERLFELEEEIRALTMHLRQHPGDEEARRALRDRVRGLTVEEAEGLVRAFATYFHLVNLAEERHRVRVNRARERESTPERPRPESLLALVGTLRARGLSFEEVTNLLASARLTLTFTAHPTETRRRTLRHHLVQIARVLDAVEKGEAGPEAVRARVALLWEPGSCGPVRRGWKTRCRAASTTCPPPYGKRCPGWWKGWSGPWRSTTAGGPCCGRPSPFVAGSGATGTATPT